MGANSSFAGTILAAGAITLGASTQVTGRALSFGTVTLADNTIRFVLPLAQLLITTSPSGSAGDVAFATQPVVAVQDSTGVVVAGDTRAVTLTLEQAGGSNLSCAAQPTTRSGIDVFVVQPVATVQDVGANTVTSRTGPLVRTRCVPRRLARSW